MTRHFLVHVSSTLMELDAGDVAEICKGQRYVDDDAVAIISVVTDPNGGLSQCFLGKLRTKGGYIDTMDRADAVSARRRLVSLAQSRQIRTSQWCEPVVRQFLENWPEADNLRAAISQQLSIPNWRLPPFTLGGPLLWDATSEPHDLDGVFHFRIVDFRGQAAEELWSALDQIGGVNDLIAATDRLEAYSTTARSQTAMARLIEFFVLSAFGYGRRLERFKYLLSANHRTYRLFIDQPWIFANFGGDVLIPLGHVNGFSAIMPLTESGFLRYMRNLAAISQLTNEGRSEPDIVDSGAESHTIPYLALTGLVYFPSVPRMLRAQDECVPFTCDDDGRFRVFPNEGRSVMERCFFPHLWEFLPPLEVEVEGDHTSVTVLKPGIDLPKIVCPISGDGMGEGALRRAGFEPDGNLPRDVRGNIKYIFDCADINNPRVSAGRRKRMCRLIAATQRRFSLR